MKCHQISHLMEKKGLDALLLFDHSGKDSNMFYMTGLHIEYSMLVINANKPDVLFVSKMEYQRARQGSKVTDVRLLPKKLDLPKTVGIDSRNLPVFYRDLLKKRFKVRFKDASDILIKARMRKNPEEIKKISRSYRLADKIISKTIKNNFSSETEILEFLAIETLKSGAELSFEPTISSGKNAAMPHHLPKGRLKDGLCIIDYGVRYDGYCSDITRTIPIGKITKMQKELYGLLLDVQLDAISALKSNIRLSDIDAKVRKDLGKYARYFIHSLGHGVGIDIHEAPSLGPLSKDILQDGMIFTIEPGIYIPGKLGIRIEDGILFDKGKAFVLSRTPKRL